MRATQADIEVIEKIITELSELDSLTEDHQQIVNWLILKEGSKFTTDGKEYEVSDASARVPRHLLCIDNFFPFKVKLIARNGRDKLKMDCSITYHSNKGKRAYTISHNKVIQIKD